MVECVFFFFRFDYVLFLSHFIQMHEKACKLSYWSNGNQKKRKKGEKNIMNGWFSWHTSWYKACISCIIEWFGWSTILNSRIWMTWIGVWLPCKLAIITT